MKKNVKRVLAVLVAIMMCTPILLLFDGGPEAPYGNETFGLTNIIGFVWLATLLFLHDWIMPEWVRREIDDMFPDEPIEDEEGTND